MQSKSVFYFLIYLKVIELNILSSSYWTNKYYLAINLEFEIIYFKIIEIINLGLY